MYLTGSSRHGWSPYRSADSGYLLVGPGENVEGRLHVDTKEILGPCISCHKHIIGNHSHINLLSPHLCPYFRLIINVPDYR